MTTKRKQALLKMLEALITDDNETAKEQFHEAARETLQSFILGEEKEEKESEDEDKDEEKEESESDEDDEKESEDEDKDEEKEESESDEDDEKESNKDKKKVNENVEGNFLKTTPKKSNETKAKKGLPKHNNLSDDSIIGNFLKKKPHKANLTKAKKQKFSDESGKGNPTNLDDGRDYKMGTVVKEGSKPSAGLSKKEKSKIAKKAQAGKDIGKKGKNFEKVAKKAAKQYGSKEAGERVAAAAMWKNAAKK